MPAPGLGFRAQSSYFEDGRHRRNVVESIADGRVPLKFAYAGSAAFTHDSYARTADYAEMMTSAVHESEVLLASRRCGPAVGELVEIGPGNGLHSAALLDCLRARGLGIRRYLGVDFSATLLRISSGVLRERFRADLAVDARVWDVEGRPEPAIERWRPGPSPILVCLVGHTLGNFEDPLHAMRNLAGVLRPGDVLLASVLLRPAPIVGRLSTSAYRTAEFRRAALEPMVAAGMNTSEMEFTVDYRDGAFIGEVRLLRAARMDGVSLPRGYRFRCFMSRRFTVDEVTRLFDRAGWSTYATEVDERNDHMTVVASRAEESR